MNKSKHSAENDALCPGALRAGDAFNHNARGRSMHLVTCSWCGREFRKQGQTTGTSETPAHEEPQGGRA